MEYQRGKEKHEGNTNATNANTRQRIQKNTPEKNPPWL